MQHTCRRLPPGLQLLMVSISVRVTCDRPGETKRSRKLHLQLKRGAAGRLLQSFADFQRIARRARRNKLPLRYNRAGTKQGQVQGQGQGQEQ